jgi:hypothetical protein
MLQVESVQGFEVAMAGARAHRSSVSASSTLLHSCLPQYIMEREWL